MLLRSGENEVVRWKGAQERWNVLGWGLWGDTRGPGVAHQQPRASGQAYIQLLGNSLSKAGLLHAPAQAQAPTPHLGPNPTLRPQPHTQALPQAWTHTHTQPQATTETLPLPQPQTSPTSQIDPGNLTRPLAPPSPPTAIESE